MITLSVLLRVSERARHHPQDHEQDLPPPLTGPELPAQRYASLRVKIVGIADAQRQIKDADVDHRRESADDLSAPIKYPKDGSLM